jgi:2-keto-4-pentenoate hydratase/2-oxohepta-3-ene-1,7-dioic acid hydratase in catechol pathway
MKLARYTHRGMTSIGAIFGDLVVPLSWLDPNVPPSLRLVLAAGPDYLRQLERALADNSIGLPLASVRLITPIPDAQKYLAIGSNLDGTGLDAQAGLAAPESRLWFNKNVNCISGPYDAIRKPRVSGQMDYEAKLGVVIGKRCRHIAVDRAREVVGGYLACNDITARDWQSGSPAQTLGKSFDTYGPIGPWITTADEIKDPHALRIKLWVNGELRQSDDAKGTMHDIWQQIEELSQVMTLEPGDLIATGACVNVGPARGEFLQPGDVVRVEIDGLGYIENRVVAEAA